MTSNNATGMLQASGQELVDLHHAGNPAGLAELQRRYAKSQKATTKRYIEKCGAAPEATEESAAPAAPAAPCVGEMTLEQKMSLILTMLGQPAATPAKPKAKKKAKSTYADKKPAGPSGVNVISEQNDGEWLVYTPGKGDRAGNIMPLEGEFAYLMDVVGAGATLREAREDFYAQVNHYLPKAFRKTVDNRGQQAKQMAALGTQKTPEEMSRDELKAALNLPASSKMRTAKMIEQLNAQQANTQEDTAPAPAKPNATQPNPQVQSLMQGVNLDELFANLKG